MPRGFPDTFVLLSAAPTLNTRTVYVHGFNAPKAKTFHTSIQSNAMPIATEIAKPNLEGQLINALCLRLFAS